MNTSLQAGLPCINEVNEKRTTWKKGVEPRENVTEQGDFNQPESQITAFVAESGIQGNSNSGHIGESTNPIPRVHFFSYVNIASPRNDANPTSSQFFSTVICACSVEASFFCLQESEITVAAACVYLKSLGVFLRLSNSAVTVVRSTTNPLKDKM